MKKRIQILQLFLLLLISTSSFSQIIYPVNLTGGGLPTPRSLDLSVYTFDRQPDLSFNARFDDPVRQTLEVTPSISVEGGGAVIYQTDPNFFGPTFVLNQFQQITIDGGDLQPYLRPEALVGANNTGMGSLLVPEGNIEICLELIGVDRRIPVSRKACIRGRFDLNQVPQLVLPTNGEAIEYEENKNITFNWNALHIGSLNSPAPVEYTFELVQMPPGTNNINDAFNSALKIFETTRLNTSLIYIQGQQPRLQPNVLYAWRVKASSLLHPTSVIFENEGFSQISAFQMYEENTDPSGINITNTITNEVNRPAPTGCSIFSTDFGPVTANPSQQLNITEEEVVKVGYFDMELTQLTVTASGYSGKGKITVPLFESQVNVEFKGLRVDQNYRVYEAEYIRGRVDRNFKLTREELKSNKIAENIDNDYIVRIDDFFKKGQGRNRLVSGFNLANPVAVDLPLGMDSKNNPTIAVIGIEFTPRNAYLQLVSWQDEGGKEMMRYAATNIESTPFGLKNGAHLVPIGGDSGNKNISGAFNIGYRRNGSSKMNISCEGFQELELTPFVFISSDLMTESSGNEQVFLQPNTPTSTPDTYIGAVRNLPDLTVSSLPDFVFKPGKTFVDLSSNATLENAPKITGFQLPSAANWRGLVMDNVVVELPKEYDFTGSGRKVSVPGGQIVLDDKEIVYGLVSRDNLVSLDEGKMGNWGYSVDNFIINFRNGSTNGAQLQGKMKVPVFTGLFDYSGALASDPSGQIIMNVQVPDEPLDMDVWKAQLSPDVRNSNINAKLADDGTGKRQFFPSAKFDGVFSMNLSDDEFSNAILGNAKEQTIRELKSGFGISTLSFNIQNINLIGLELQPASPVAERYVLDLAQLDGATANLGSAPASINTFELISEITGTIERLGWKTILSSGNNKVELIFWAKADNSSFAFEGIEAKVIKIQCNCLSALESTSDERWGYIIDEVINQHYQHLFDPSVSSGSLASFGIAEKKEGWQLTLRNALSQKIRKNTLGGFPMTDAGEVVIPFLDAKKLALDDNNEGVIAPDFSNRENYTFANLDAKATIADQQNMLPFDITNSLDKLGLTGRSIPKNARFLITGFRPSNVQNESWQSSTMDLTFIYQINENSHLLFSRTDIPVTTSSVDFSNLFLSLEKAVSLDDVVSFLPGNGTNDQANGSFTSITCEKGFELFNVQAVYTAPFGENSTKIKTINTDGTAAPVKFDFTVNSATSLKSFIASLKSTSNGVEWNFAAESVEQLIYHPGNAFEGYLDYDSERAIDNVSNVGNANSPNFKGLIFKNLEVELAGMKESGGNALQFEVTDVMVKNDVGVITPKIMKTNPIARSNNASISGWQYEVEEFSYQMVEGKLSEEKWRGENYVEGGVHLKGKLKVPALKDLDNNPQLKNLGYTSGWVTFDGTVGVNSADQKYRPVAELRTIVGENEKFLMEGLPGISISPDEEHGISTIAMIFDDQSKQFTPSAELSGNAAIEITSQLIQAYGSELNAAQVGLQGVDLKIEDLKVEGMKVTSADLSDMEIGLWGRNDVLNANTAEAFKFQGFPGASASPVLSKEGNTLKMQIPTTLNLVTDKEQPQSAAATAGLSSSGTIDFTVNQTSQGVAFQTFQMSDFEIEGDLGSASVKGNLQVSGNSENASLRTEVTTEIEGRAVTAPIELAVKEDGARYANIDLSDLDEPLQLNGKNVLSVSVGVDQETFSELNPGMEVENLDAGQSVQIMTYTPEPDGTVPDTVANSVPTDQEVPAPPTDIEATITKGGQVTLSWKNSLSDDVRGYWLYWANSPNDEFSKVNNQVAFGNSFEYQIDSISLNPYIYYVIKAEDRAFNKSISTDILEVTRPDNISPISPFLTNVEARSEGLVVNWTPSPSEDVVNQKLYKRVVSSGYDQEWSEVTTLESTADQFVDVFAKIDMEIQYRLTAIDAAGNESDFSNFKSNQIGFPSATAVATNFRINSKRRTIYPDVKPQVPVTIDNDRLETERGKLNQLKEKVKRDQAALAVAEKDYIGVRKDREKVIFQYRELKNEYGNLRRQRPRPADYGAKRTNYRQRLRALKRQSRGRRRYRSERKIISKLKRKLSTSIRAVDVQKNNIKRLLASDVAEAQPKNLLVPELRWSYNPRNSELATTPYSFEIWKSSGNKQLELVELVASTENRFLDENVEEGVLYNYAMRVRYSNGWLGEISAIETINVRA